MKKKIKGTLTIEAAVIIPIILFIFAALIHILFYWHDKCILMSTAHETAAVGSSREGISELELEYYFFDRMDGKLLLFTRVECLTRLDDKKVTVICDGSKDQMSAKVTCCISKTAPEDYIRDIRKLQKIGEGIVKQE